MQRSLDVAFTFDSQLEAAFQGLSRRLSATTKGGSGVKGGYTGAIILCECCSRIVIEIVLAIKFCLPPKRKRLKRYLLVPPNEKSPKIRNA